MLYRTLSSALLAIALLLGNQICFASHKDGEEEWGSIFV